MIPGSVSRTIPKKRRNGMLQSCEPCRKRKLSCDHRLSACGRFVRRGTSSSCFYHPAPVTKSTKIAPISPAVSDVSSPPPTSYEGTNWSHEQTAVHHTPQSQPARRDTIALDLRPPEILSVPSAGILMDSSNPASAKGRNVGFLGETSSSAVVAELNSSMSINPPPEAVPTAFARDTSIPESHARSGAEVLAFFQNMDKTKEFIDRWFVDFGNAYVLFRPMYRVWLDGLVPFAQGMMNDRRPDRLERRCHLIWRNTQQPLQHTGTTSCRDWALQSTGENLRWETLGLVLFIVSALAATLPGWDSAFKTSDGAWEKKT